MLLFSNVQFCLRLPHMNQHYSFPPQGLPGPPGEKGENGDVGSMVSLAPTTRTLVKTVLHIVFTYRPQQDGEIGQSLLKFRRLAEFGHSPATWQKFSDTFQSHELSFSSIIVGRQNHSNLHPCFIHAL